MELSGVPVHHVLVRHDPGAGPVRPALAVPTRAAATTGVAAWVPLPERASAAVPGAAAVAVPGSVAVPP
ncbi:hypothetical protein, partial [Mycobacterium tuberculosis]|uniref:hypothetical protein n=1 Tax=Mycobacterium tuberculosis TaxID=1773 RepID=UPI0023501DA3